MIRFALSVLMTAFVSAGAALAQDTPIDDSQADVAASAIRATNGSGAMLRGLDKLNGIATDIEVTAGDSVEIGRISVTLGECRYPEDNPSGEAFAWMTITDPSRDVTLFEGWMIASSPALSALDHPRYDVWVIRCTTA